MIHDENAEPINDPEIAFWESVFALDRPFYHCDPYPYWGA